MAFKTESQRLKEERNTLSVSPSKVENDSSNSTPRQNTFTIYPSGISKSKDLNHHEKDILCYLLRQAAYLRTIREIPLSISQIMEEMGINHKKSFLRAQEALTTKGYIEKSVKGTENGKITNYKLNLKKIENDFNFEFKTIFCK